MMGIVMILFFWALARLPLAEVIALSFIAPLLALILAALLLGERIRRSTIWASLGCIAGVAIIVAGKLDPSTYRHEAMLGVGAVLISAVFYAYNLILARRQAQVARPLEIIFFQNLALAIMLACVAPWLAMAVPAELWPHVAGVTALSMAGQSMMSWAYGRAEAQYLIPTEYTAFVWGILLGWYFFGEAVTLPTLLGTVVIIAACLFAARSSAKLPEPVEATI
jgi:S-adenosylmethionine uptake transporter